MQETISWLHCTQKRTHNQGPSNFCFSVSKTISFLFPKKEAIQNTKLSSASYLAKKKVQEIQHLIIKLELRLCSLTASTLYTFSISIQASQSDNVKRCPLYCGKSKGKYAAIILQNKLGASKILQAETKYSSLSELALPSGL